MRLSALNRLPRPGRPRVLFQMWVGCLIAALIARPATANEYREMFEQIAKTDRTTWAPSLAGVKFSQSLLVANQYFEALSAKFTGLIADIEAKNQQGAELLGTLEALWSDPNIDNYQSFIKTALQYRLLASHTKERIHAAREVAETFRSHRDFFSDFCPQRVAQLPPLEDVRSLPQFVSKDGKVYTRYSHVFNGKQYNTFSEDPKAEAAAITSLGAAILVGIGIYAMTAGVGFGAAMGALFSASASGGGIALVGTGPGAVIILAAVAVAVVVGMAVTEHENRRRKKKAKERYEREMREYEEAKRWYLAHRVTQDEFKDIALQSCQSNFWQGKISDSEKALHENIQVLEPQLTALARAEAQISENDERVGALAGDYAESLVALHGAAYLKALRDSLVSQEKENTAIRYFNEVIKPESLRLSRFYAENRTDCFSLEEQYYRTEAELKEHEGLLTRSYRDAGNQGSDFFARQLPEGIRQILGVFKKRVDRCFEREGVNEGLGPIYAL